MVDIYDVRDYGAVGDGGHPATAGIQAAIDACAHAGGGTVVIPRGTYLTGTLFLRSNVELHLAMGATLLGSRNLSDYDPAIVTAAFGVERGSALVYGEGLENVAISGHGVIDGQGADFDPKQPRPYLLRLVRCRKVSVSDVTLRDSAVWVSHYLECSDVQIRGITINSHCNRNNDGIDIDGCQRVRISDCNISSQDDGICLKSTTAAVCRDVVVTNCVVSSERGAIKLGTPSVGGFMNIAISNCAIYDTKMGGIKLLCVDGGRLENVAISNMVMDNVDGALFVRLGARGTGEQRAQGIQPIGCLQDVRISNIEARVTGRFGRLGSCITGIPNNCVRRLTLSNIHFSYPGGHVADEVGDSIPELPAAYPELHMFGTLPAYGLYIRHAQDIRLHEVSFDLRAPDCRPALYCHDVTNLAVTGCSAAYGSQPNVVLHSAQAVGSIGLHNHQYTGEE